MNFPVVRPIVRNRLGILGDPAAIEIGVQVGFKGVVARHFMALATFLAEAEPAVRTHPAKTTGRTAFGAGGLTAAIRRQSSWLQASSYRLAGRRSIAIRRRPGGRMHLILDAT